MYYILVSLWEEGFKYLGKSNKQIYIAAGIFAIFEFIIYLHYFQYDIPLLFFIILRIVAIYSHFCFVAIGMNLGTTKFMKYIISVIAHTTYNIGATYNMPLLFIMVLAMGTFYFLINEYENKNCKL